MSAPVPQTMHDYVCAQPSQPPSVPEFVSEVAEGSSITSSSPVIASIEWPEEDLFTMLGGAGGGLEIVKGIPLVDDDNFCRYRCIYAGGGLKKFTPTFQYFCLRFDGGPQLVTDLPIISGKEGKEQCCWEECMCCECGCISAKPDLIIQYYCLRVDMSGDNKVAPVPA